MTNEKIKEIKQSFRLMMNGTASRSMREKGADYKLNWGVSLPDLQAMAEEIGKDYELAISLWKEDVRECKILATMLMPPEKRIKFSATTPIDCAKKGLLNSMPTPSVPAIMPMTRNSRRVGTPKRYPVFSARMLMNSKIDPTSRKNSTVIMWDWIFCKFKKKY